MASDIGSTRDMTNAGSVVQQDPTPQTDGSTKTSAPTIDIVSSQTVDQATLDSIHETLAKTEAPRGMTAAPKIAAPPANADTTLINTGLLNKDELAVLSETQNTMAGAMIKMLDPSNNSDSVKQARQEFASNMGTQIDSVYTMANVSLNDVAITFSKELQPTTIQDINNFIPGKTTLSKTSVTDLTILALSYMVKNSALSSQSMANTIKSIQNVINYTYTEMMNKQTEQAQKAMEQLQEQVKSASSSKIGEIFGWVAVGLMFLAGAIMVATGFGVAAGVGLLVAATVMTVNNILQETGTYAKNPTLAKVMGIVVPAIILLTTVITGGIGIAGSAAGLATVLASIGLGLSSAGAGIQLTQGIADATPGGGFSSEVDQDLGYAAAALMIAGGAASAGSAMSGGAKAAEAGAKVADAADDAAAAAAKGADAAEDVVTSTSEAVAGGLEKAQAVGKYAAAGAQAGGDISEIVSAAYEIKAALANMSIADLQKLIDILTASMNLLQAQADQDKSPIDMLTILIQDNAKSTQDITAAAADVIQTAGLTSSGITAGIGSV